MAVTFDFDPERVAYFEAAGWRAYYDHKWFKMLRLLVGLCQEQFHIPFPMSLIAAYYTTRASLAWVPIDHDERKVLAYLEKFYRVVRRIGSYIRCIEGSRLGIARLRRRPTLIRKAREKDEFLQTL